MSQGGNSKSYLAVVSRPPVVKIDTVSPPKNQQLIQFVYESVVSYPMAAVVLVRLVWASLGQVLGCMRIGLPHKTPN